MSEFYMGKNAKTKFNYKFSFMTHNRYMYLL